MSKIQNGIIESADIKIQDGILTLWLFIKHSGGTQRFGGTALYLPLGYKYYKKEGVAGHHIYRILEIAGVKNWSDLQGKAVKVKGTYEKIEGIGHIIDNDWFFLIDDEVRKL